MPSRRGERHAPQGFDVLVSAGGLVVVVTLVVAGALGIWGYSFATSNVHNQLAQQRHQTTV